MEIPVFLVLTIFSYLEDERKGADGLPDVIFLLQFLRFVINLKMSVLIPTQQITNILKNDCQLKGNVFTRGIGQENKGKVSRSSQKAKWVT